MKIKAKVPSSFTTEKSFDNNMRVSFAHVFGEDDEDNIMLRKKEKTKSFNSKISSRPVNAQGPDARTNVTIKDKIGND